MRPSTERRLLTFFAIVNGFFAGWSIGDENWASAVVSGMISLGCLLVSPSHGDSIR